MIITEAMEPIQTFNAAAHKGGLRKTLLDLVQIRASQINGCSSCVYSGTINAKQLGETDERLSAVAAGRDTPLFTAAERAALALTEAVTGRSDCADPLPDEIWDEAAKHFDERGLAALLIEISAPRRSTSRLIPGRRIGRATTYATWTFWPPSHSPAEIHHP